jgi:integrase
VASLFKRGGKKNRRGSYFVSYFDENGKRQTTSTRTADHAAACEVRDKITANVARRSRGIITADEERLVAQGRRPLPEHVSDYLAACEFEQQSRAHIQIKRTQLNNLFTAIKATRLADVEINKVQAYLQELKKKPARQNKKLKPGEDQQVKSNRTVNQSRTTAVAFCQWCVEKGRLAENPLTGLPVLNEALDPRRSPKPMTEDQVLRLVMVSPKRRDFYLVWAHTGLRIGTLKKLVAADVNLELGVLRVRAKANKSKKEKLKPLHEEAVEALRRLLPPGAAPDQRVFPHVPRLLTFYRDLERAGIERMDAQGRQIYRHCSRHTIGTKLALQGVPAAVTQKLMDHADPRTTAKHYSLIELADMRKVVSAMPRIIDAADLQQKVQQSGREQGQTGASVGGSGNGNGNGHAEGTDACPTTQLRYNADGCKPVQAGTTEETEGDIAGRIFPENRAISSVG